MTTDTSASGPIPEDTQDAETNAKKDTPYSDSKVWERGLYMVLFGFVGYFAFMGVLVLAIVQFLFKLLSGEENQEILKFNRSLATYLKQISDFLGFVSDEKPCPFSPFPSGDAEDVKAPSPSNSDSAKPDTIEL